METMRARDLHTSHKPASQRGGADTTPLPTTSPQLRGGQRTCVVAYEACLGESDLESHFE